MRCHFKFSCCLIKGSSSFAVNQTLSESRYNWLWIRTSDRALQAAIFSKISPITLTTCQQLSSSMYQRNDPVGWRCFMCNVIASCDRNVRSEHLYPNAHQKLSMNCSMSSAHTKSLRKNFYLLKNLSRMTKASRLSLIRRISPIGTAHFDFTVFGFLSFDFIGSKLKLSTGQIRFG